VPVSGSVCAKRLNPQQTTSPPASSAHVCAQEMATVSKAPTGVSFWPSRLFPQQVTVSSSAIAQLWFILANTAL